MNWPRIFQRVYLTPLCVHDHYFGAVHAFLLPRMQGQVPIEVHVERGRAATNDLAPQAAGPTKRKGSARRAQSAGPKWGYNPQGEWDVVDENFFTMAKPGVAVIPIYGALAKNLSAWEEACGAGTDINGLQHALAQAVADPDITTIVLDIDSPGGEVTGIPEFGAQIRAAAAVKPVYAFTDAMMASAAYWLASQATEIYVTGSSSVGSIGTYLAWLDPSVKMQMEGVQLRLYAEGKHKGLGLPGRPMSAEDDALLKNRVKSINENFKATVRGTRGKVADSSMEGQTFPGDETESLGLSDGLVRDFDELIDLLPI